MSVADAQGRALVRAAPRWLPLALSLVAAAIVLALGYSALNYLRNSSFNDERAFRVLGELIGQYHNFETALSGTLSLVPANAKADTFLPSLSFEGLRELDVKPCGPNERQQSARMEIDISAAERAFKVVAACGPSTQRNSRNANFVALWGGLAAQTPRFSQRFFDSAILATPRGAVLLNLSGVERASGVQLHAARSDQLLLADVSGLLRNAAEQEVRQDRGARNAKDDKAVAVAATPSHPIVFTDAIAGEDYRVYVHAFEPNLPLKLLDGGETHTGDHRLYLIGLKRQLIVQPMLDALGPGGVLTLTLLVLLAIMSWPLLGLKFATAQEAFSPAQVFAVVAALLLIPSVLTVLGFSIWSRYRLTLWADEQAEVHARQVEAALLEELSHDVRILDDLGSQFVARLKLEKPENFKQGEEPAACFEGECKHVLRAPPAVFARAGELDWRPLRAGAVLDLGGVSSGLRFSLFGKPAESGELNLQDREYVQAIRSGEEWRPGDLWGAKVWSDLALHSPRHGFVAQRLLNRADGATVLQIAVPLHAGNRRVGLITADTRAYALTAAIRTPWLRFAVVDRRGAVLFHSDDARSLSENLLVETGQNAALLHLLGKRAWAGNLERASVEDHFGGRYLGASHRFFYRAVSGAPWGVVVFYPTDSLADVVLQTAVATLAAYLTLATAAIIAFALLVLVAPGRLDQRVLAAIWPKWRERGRYRVVALGLWTLVACVVAYLAFRLRAPQAAPWFVLAAVVAGIASAVWLSRRTPTSAEEHAGGVESYKAAYEGCMMALMCLLGVAPTLFLAADYYDTSVRASVRSELQLAADDIQQRRWAIANDLQRFYSYTDLLDAAPSAQKLTQLVRAPGFEFTPPQAQAEPGARPRPATWRLVDTPDGLWLSNCGPPVLGPMRRTIWSLSTATQARRERAAVAVRAADEAGAGTLPVIQKMRRRCDADAVTFWLRRDDGERFAIAMPLQSARTLASIRRDEELLLRGVLSGLLLPVGLVLLSLLLLLLLAAYVAKRLFGIDTPFPRRFGATSGAPFQTAELLQAELELRELRKQQGSAFTSKDEADWRAERCRPIYESLWSNLAANEQLLVHQLATGRFANPQNRAVMERLLSRGYLKLWPWPRIADAGFAEYLRASEVEHNFAQLQREAASNWWRRVRTPLLIVVIVLAALLMWLAGSAMQILSATLAGVAALFSSLTQVTAFARSAGKPDAK